MTFIQRVEFAADTPVTRPPTCRCGPLLGDWAEGCPEHPMDDDMAPYFAAVRQIQEEHTPACRTNAAGWAADLGLDGDAAEQAGAQALEDGDIDCICS